ncbi:metal-dependent hydrolase [Thermincola ferriacetica]|uniref:Metal-dependent hydrolase n=1 Tax=Thermincola ferriacetica TaxID=281456 RepID=A0A0L6W3C7_9FIRM|nr:MBL fold metallo-hydrolase [Thermincola ferriacetica]KNZ69589.1 metal-dependent hydrolase [Thermincola ferriacetica]
MKFTVLGCWAPYQKAGGACSGYLLQSENTNVLLDCGNGVFANLQRYINFRHLDAVIISHFHPDHYLDLFCLRHAVMGATRDGSRRGLLPLYIPGTPEKIYQQLNRYADVFQIFKIEPGNSIVIKDLVFRFIRTEHALETYGLTAAEGNLKFGYTADTRYFPGLVDFFRGCNLLVAEASVLEQDKKYAEIGHLTVRQAAQLANETGTSRLVLTHFWPEYDPVRIRAEALAVFDRVELAGEGKVFTIENTKEENAQMK